MKSRLLALAFVTSALLGVALSKDQPRIPESKERRIRAEQVFVLNQPVIFQDNFTSGNLDRWNLSENDQYRLATANPERISVVDAPLLPRGRKAVRMVVQRAPNSFRSEISLPFEKGFNERWYGERILIPDEWVFDVGKANDIVLQWHAIPGNWRATYPNLEISIGNDRWFIRQSFGSAQTNPTRTNTKLDESVKRGVWISWVIQRSGRRRTTACCKSGRMARSSSSAKARTSMAPSAWTTHPT